VKTSRILLLALFFLLIASLYWRLDALGTVTGVVAPFNSENLYALYYPLIHYGIESMKAMHIPLWNPYQSLGAPFLGSALFGLFSPFSLLYYILPTHLAMGWSTVLNITLAGLFTFLFLNKGLKTSVPAAITGALVFMFSGPLLLEIIHPSLVGAMAFLPLLLYLVHKVFETQSPRWAIAFGVILACQILTGAVQVIVHTLFLTGAFGTALFIGSFRERKASFSPPLLLVLGGLMALALSSLQWLPLLELSALTGRNSAGLSLKEVEPFRAFFTPWTVTMGVLFGGRGLSIGILPALLGLLALCTRKKRPFVIFFTVTALLTLVLSFGTHTPLYGIYYHYIPTGKMFRVPMRWLWLTAFSLAVLSAMGMETLFHALQGRRGLRTASLLMVPLIITAFLFQKNPHALFNHPQNTPEIFSRHAEEGAFLRKVQGTYRTYISSDFGVDFSLLQKFGTLEKVYVLNDYESLSLGAYQRFAAAVLGRDDILEQKVFYGAFELNGGKRSRRLMRLLSIGFIMEKGGRVFGKRQPPGMKEIYGKKGVKIYRYLGALPRAYVVYRSETIPDEKDALSRLASEDFEPGASVILDKDVGLGKEPSSPSGAAPGRPAARARIKRLLPERIEIRANLEKKGVLVLTDFFYPGWRAYVDNEERPILRANAIMRGLVLEKGRHNVVFIYRPRPFRAGLLASVLTLAATLLYLGADLMRKARKRP
jgi:hypothetical protein